MSTQFMVTATGANQPGLIKKLAEKTHLRGGVWLNSKIIHLGGLFAGIVHVSVPEENADKLKEDLRQLGDFSIVFSEPAESSSQATQPFEMKFETSDRPGIINDITSVLTDDGIAIENMACHRFNVSSIGETVFSGKFSLLAPPDLDKDELIEELEALYANETRVTLE